MVYELMFVGVVLSEGDFLVSVMRFQYGFNPQNVAKHRRNIERENLFACWTQYS